MAPLRTLPFARRDHYRARAEECRTIADAFHDDNARREMLEVAAGYDRMAETAEKIERMAETAGKIEVNRTTSP